MDDLDRLAFRLTRTIRSRFPQLLTGGFTFTDLEERLLVFRDVRREMASGTVDAFEHTMLRLISGEREYLTGDELLQEACRHALSSPSPTLSLVRAWAGSHLALGPSAHGVGAERVTGAFDAVTGHPERAVAPTMAASPPSSPSLPSVDSLAALTIVPTPPRADAACGCRYCGGRLPRERNATFCPHCGLDLTKHQCPACSTQLEVGWRFCVTCGRSTDLPDIPATTPAVALRAS